MFMDLEKVLPAGVRVVSIEPKQDKGRVEVKFIIGAASDEAKVKLLESTGRLEDVHAHRTGRRAASFGRDKHGPDRRRVESGIFEELMHRDFTLQKRAILVVLGLLLAADLGLAIYSWRLASSPQTPRRNSTSRIPS